jgi:hypothetical protein
LAGWAQHEEATNLNDGREQLGYGNVDLVDEFANPQEKASFSVRGFLVNTLDDWDGVRASGRDITG